MKKNILAICDKEEAYVHSLTEYLSEKKSTAFEVLAFTDISSLVNYSREHFIDLLLISADMMCDEVKGIPTGKTMVLSSQEGYGQDTMSVYKYQSSDLMISEVMGTYASSSEHISLVSETNTRSKLIGIYSPISRIGKTAFSLILGMILAEKEKTLYLNLEDYSGFEAFSKGSGISGAADLSDLIYFARQKEGNLILKLSSMLQNMDGLDYILPSFSPFDLRDVTALEWQMMFRVIEEHSDYQNLILDMGNRLEEELELLSMCRTVYIPVLEDPVSKAKLEQFEANVKALDMVHLLKKIRYLKLPKIPAGGRKEINLQDCRKGEWGHYVRKLLAEEKR